MTSEIRLTVFLFSWQIPLLATLTENTDRLKTLSLTTPLKTLSLATLLKTLSLATLLKTEDRQTQVLFVILFKGDYVQGLSLRNKLSDPVDST